MRIALAGNPNSGKTTMYNALTGSKESVGNWAGVTVDKKESPIKRSIYEGEKELIAVDLPGAYSMSPFTSEESITRDYIQTENPDVIVNIVDATNLSRSLFFTTQLMELGIPVVVALNKSDVNDKKGNEITKVNYPSSSSIFSEGLLNVFQDGKCGYINTKGELVIPLIFDDANKFDNGYAIVIYNGEDAIIDKKGNVYLAKDLITGNKDAFVNVCGK